MNNTNAVNVGLTIASKSIPRSGHHLLKEILKAGFGEKFAHCEWYFQPGCCRQVPCRFRDAYSSRGQLIHMIKSHDFNLEDEIPDAKANVVTLIGYRHPLWSLTSNFVYELRQFKPKLAITVYHDFKDFWTIPQYLDSLGLGYRFYLRHFTIHAEETILFAIAR